MRRALLGVLWIVAGVMFWGQAVVDAAPSQDAPLAGPADEIITLKIDGWTCASCEKGIRRALLAVPGVKRADVSYARGGAVVEVAPGRVSHEQLIQAVASAGTILSSYRASVVPNGTLMARSAEQEGPWSWVWDRFK
ncbi:heavy-metal-associated domain-containing protein [Nitrospira sp. Kam-Ns4a]